MRTAPEEQFISSKLDQEFAEAGLPSDSPLRHIIDQDAQVIEGVGLPGQRAYCVKIVRDGRPAVSIRERLTELRSEPRSAVSSTDSQAIRNNFADIAAGKVIVR